MESVLLRVQQVVHREGDAHWVSQKGHGRYDGVGEPLGGVAHDAVVGDEVVRVFDGAADPHLEDGGGGGRPIIA